MTMCRRAVVSCGCSESAESQDNEQWRMHVGSAREQQMSCDVQLFENVIQHS
jgi:hypothetical protein